MYDHMYDRINSKSAPQKDVAHLRFQLLKYKKKFLLSNSNVLNVNVRGQKKNYRIIIIPIKTM